MQIPGVDYSIRYNQKDITKEIASFISSITYTDNSEGESDDLQIQLDDSTNLWVNGWYPMKGDKISLRIGKMECGQFEID
jgi:phage protein D